MPTPTPEERDERVFRERERRRPPRRHAAAAAILPPPLLPYADTPRRLLRFHASTLLPCQHVIFFFLHLFHYIFTFILR